LSIHENVLVGRTAMAGRLRIALGTERPWGWRSGPPIRLLRRHRVEFVVIGGVAASFYAPSRPIPNDLDVVVVTSPGSALGMYEALCQIVREVPLRSSPPEFSAAGFRMEAEMRVEASSWTLHVVGAKAGVDAADLLQRAQWVPIDRAWTPICSRDDLLSLKMRDGRPTDVADVELLRTHVLAIRSGRRRRASGGG
jgi:hypothetical protein